MAFHRFPMLHIKLPAVAKEEQAWPGHQVFQQHIVEQKTDQQGDEGQHPVFSRFGNGRQNDAQRNPDQPRVAQCADDNHRAVQQGCAQMRLNPEQCACVH